MFHTDRKIDGRFQTTSPGQGATAPISFLSLLSHQQRQECSLFLIGIEPFHIRGEAKTDKWDLLCLESRSMQALRDGNSDLCSCLTLHPS